MEFPCERVLNLEGSSAKQITATLSKGIGPGRVNFATSLYKSFALIELRFESFNTFNHTEFNNFNDSYGSSRFGQVTSAWDPRNLEPGGKFVF